MRNGEFMVINEWMKGKTHFIKQSPGWQNQCEHIFEDTL